MLELRTEWLDEPGVNDPVLRRTWCGLEIIANDHVVSRFYSERSQSVRSTVFVSAFPLAKWIVHNWWSLLWEGCRSDDLGARLPLNQDRQRLWVWLARHSLFFGRDGMMVPNLVLARDDEAMLVAWTPTFHQSPTGSRFIAEGSTRMDPSEVEGALGDFVQRVLHRICESRDKLVTTEVDELRENWEAILRSDSDERWLAQAFGALGLDPYDGDSWDDELFTAVQRSKEELDASVQAELLATSTSDSLPRNLTTTVELLRSLRSVAPTPSGWNVPFATTLFGEHAYKVGYEMALQARAACGLNGEAIGDLPGLIRSHFGDFVEAPVIETPHRDVQAALTTGEDQGRTIACVASRQPQAQRFLQARALYRWLAAPGRSTHALITSAHTWHQRASRAFAAELLAPGSALERKVGVSAGDEDIHRLAEEYRVSPWVVGHQLENRGVSITP